MTTRISVPISELDEDFLRKLKEKYAGYTRLDIQVVEMGDKPALTEDEFWHIIEKLDWSATTPEAVLVPAVQALAEHPLGHIFQFEDMLATKLQALDTSFHAAQAYPEPEPFSEDGFLYVRAAVLASGQERYRQVVKNPTQMPADEDFEPLLSLAALAYEAKTGQSFDYISPISYETYANAEGWQ